MQRQYLPHSDICQGVYVKIIRAMTQKPKTFNKDLFFRALADRTRLRILNLMRSDEVCVCFFVEVLKTHQPNPQRWNPFSTNCK